jgi:cell division protein FtsZ
VQGIAELITRPGLINVDFADVRTVMAEMGMAMMGSGTGKGQDRARIAAEAAVASPLLEDINLTGARGLLVNITSGMDITMGEFEEVGNTIKNFSSDDATVVVGTVIDPSMTDEVRVTVVATGLESAVRAKEEPIPFVRPKQNLETDYKTLDRPTVIRNKADKEVANLEKTSPEYLDIPAFLRRQAD